MNLGNYLLAAKKSLFRFEYLQQFDVPGEREYFRTYKATGKVEIQDMMQDWWDFLKIKHAKGVHTQRVRLVRIPMTDYTEWELHIHRRSSQRGDDIRILEEAKLIPELEEGLLGDFWLIDDVRALKMNYDSTGKYLGFDEMNPQPYINAKEYLLKNSTSI